MEPLAVFGIIAAVGVGLCLCYYLCRRLSKLGQREEDRDAILRVKYAPLVEVIDFPSPAEARQLVANVAGDIEGPVEGVEALISPVSGARCVYYQVVVEEHRPLPTLARAHGVLQDHAEWQTIFTEERAVDFVVHDDTGSAIVRTHGGSYLFMEVISSAKTWVVSEATPNQRIQDYLSSHIDMNDERRSYRVGESLLRPRSNVTILGLLRGPQVEGQIPGPGMAPTINPPEGTSIVVCQTVFLAESEGLVTTRTPALPHIPWEEYTKLHPEALEEIEAGSSQGLLAGVADVAVGDVEILTVSEHASEGEVGLARESEGAERRQARTDPAGLPV